MQVRRNRHRRLRQKLKKKFSFFLSITSIANHIQHFVLEDPYLLKYIVEKVNERCIFGYQSYTNGILKNNMILPLEFLVMKQDDFGDQELKQRIAFYLSVGAKVSLVGYKTLAAVKSLAVFEMLVTHHTSDFWSSRNCFLSGNRFWNYHNEDIHELLRYRQSEFYQQWHRLVQRLFNESMPANLLVSHSLLFITTLEIEKPLLITCLIRHGGPLPNHKRSKVYVSPTIYLARHILRVGRLFDINNPKHPCLKRVLMQRIFDVIDLSFCLH